MRNLYERLKPEVKSFLLLQEELYPSAIPYITGSLKQAHSVLDLKYDVVLEFSLYADLNDYKPSTVFSQFEEL
jgi:hypothetical protein